MSNKYLTLVWEHSRAKGSELLVLLAIADHADESGHAYPGIARLAKKARIDERSVRRAIKALERIGEIRADRGGGRKSSRYWVLTNLTNDSLSPHPGQSVTPGVTPAPPQPGRQCQGSPDIAVSPEPSYKPHPTHKEGAHARGVEGTKLPAGFDISEDVKAWAASKGIDRLKDHLEAFKLKALAKGYLNANWDAAFKRAVMEDWAELRKGAASSGSAPPGSINAITKPCARCSQSLTGGFTRMAIGDVCNRCWSAYRRNEWEPAATARGVADPDDKHEPERAAA